MPKEAKMIMNMAMSIAELNGTEIGRMDLNKSSIGGHSYYTLAVWYSDGKEIIIRSDCTIIDCKAEGR